MSECGDKLAAEGKVSKQQAEDILQRIRNMAIQRAQATGQPIGEAVKAVTSEMKAQDKMLQAMNMRARLLGFVAKSRFKDFVARFGDKPGDGIMAFLEGRTRDVMGARNSVDYQIKSINAKYFGRLVAELEQNNLLRQFRRNELNHEIYQEMGEIRDGGTPGISGSADAQKIAGIIDGVTKEMVARENRAGAFIADLPGYVVRQTHDTTAIRAMGRGPGGVMSQSESFRAWRDFTAPLLDQEKTFMGADPEKFLQNVHEGIYTGVHGASTAQWTMRGWGVHGELAKKVSASRVLHFSDAEAAFKYNEKFGLKDLREQVLTDVYNRSRQIGLMENLGPDPEMTLAKGVREVKESARSKDNAADVLKNINDNKVMASFRQLTGENQIPANPNMARVMGNIKTLTQMAKMGGVFLSKLFGDKAFMQSEMMHQGISTLTTLGKQITGIAKRSTDELQTLRLMGVGLDGLMGNALSRYSDVGMMSGVVNRAQRAFFDINFLNYWTDVHKMSAGELMASHLGENATLSHSTLPEDLSRVLKLYDIGPKEWDQIRGTAIDRPDGGKMITAQGIQGLDLKPRERDRLETSLRTYFQDRIDYAVPTPGASERRLTTQDTKAGTPLGEAIRLLMLFKSFPITIANKIMLRDIYGRGSNSVGEWLMNDHKGKFNLATMIAMATAGGYLGQVVRDGINGKTPRELISDGSINWDVLNEAAVRGGGLGMMGDIIAHDYERHSLSFLESMAGPIIGQTDKAAQMFTDLKHGELKGRDVGKMTLDNTPLINLFYVRPVLNYYVLWNLENMMDPSRTQNMISSAERSHQRYFMGPAAR